MRTPKVVMQPGWNEIKSLGWGTWSGDFHKVGDLLWKRYTPNTIGALRQFVGAQAVKLYQRVKEWERNNGRHLDIGSDDGFNDVVHHVVGMGEDEFNRVMLDPTLLEDRYNADYGSPEGYQESFAYCFHSDRD